METFASIIDGKPVTSNKTFEVINPATGEVLGLVPESTGEQVNQAVAAAKKAQPAWAALPDVERKAILMKMAEVLKENAEYLAQWITKEQGKPLAGPGSMFEMQACAAWTEVTASLDLPVEVVFEDETRRDELHHKPIGVVGAISPWNWPLMIAIWQIMPSLRAGNTVVIKPSEYTPIGTLEMVRLLNTVLPPGVLNVVSGLGEVGSLLVSHPDVNKIMFTGSTATGKKIIAASGGNMARLTLECGGNDPAIILPGTDIASKAGDLFWGAFINMGQTCACAKRLYVHEDDYDVAVKALTEVAEQMPMGNGMEENILLGPIQNRMQYDKVNALVEDAKKQGATVHRGGSPLGGDGYFYPITLIGGLDNGHRLVDEEQFGPVLPIIKYRDVEEAIAKANDSKNGLGASVWADDIEAAMAVASRIIAGTVWINQHGAIHPMVPFGGVKESGYGVEFGIEGLKATTQPQVISIKKAAAA